MQWEKFGAQGDLGILFTKSRKLGLVNYRLSPLGLYWGNRENNLDLQNEVVATVSSICGRWNTLNLIWNIRYNTQDTLQTTLIRLGDKNCQVRTSATHVLIIAGQSYAQVLARAKSVTRQQVRYGLGAELEVRKLETKQDLDKHEALYLNWVKSKDIHPKPLPLFRKLSNECSGASLVGAFKGERLLAAILLFKDANEWFYWHGVRDSAHDRYFATDVLLSHAIREACEEGVFYFNMGGSNNIRSLEFFKERWGAQKQPIWSLRWDNPYWNRLFMTLQRITESSIINVRRGR